MIYTVSIIGGEKVFRVRNALCAGRDNPPCMLDEVGFLGMYLHYGIGYEKNSLSIVGVV